MRNELNCLLIDNDEDDQEIFAMALQEINPSITCTVATDCIQAINILTTDLGYLPSFIFIDMNMPLMNGKQCLIEVKKITRLKEVPVYMYSTAANPASIQEVKGLGAQDFIVKPASFRELTNVLSSLLRLPKSSL